MFMKWFWFFSFLMVFNISGAHIYSNVYGHTINYPLFDRTDTPTLRIEKIVLGTDTTYVFCKYYAEDNSWANISQETFLLSHETGQKYTLLRCEGIPFSPAKRYFNFSGEYSFLFCFPAVKSSKYIDFIESPNDEAFNIYGISLTHENDSSLAQFSFEHALSLSNKAEFYNSTGNFDKAIDIAEQAVKIWKVLLGRKSQGYANSVINLTYSCLCGEKYEKAIRYGEENLWLCEELFGAESDESSLSLQILGSCYYYLSNNYQEKCKYQEALEYAQKAVATLEKLPDNELFYDALGELSTCYYVNGYYKDALIIGNKRYDQLAIQKGKDYWQTVDAAIRLSNYYGSLGYNDEKEKLLLEAIDGARKDTTKLAPTLLSSALNNLAMYYVNSNPQKALEYEEESYKIRKDLLDYGRLLTNQSLYNLGICLNKVAIEESNLKKAEMAYDCIFGALIDAKSILGENDYRYADMKKIITDFMMMAKNYEEAIKNEKEMAQIYQSAFGTKHLSFLQTQERMANICFLRNAKEDLIYYVNEVVKGYEQYVSYNFPILTSIEKAKLINNIEFFYDQLLPAIAYYQNSPETNSMLYDAQLFRKGILLSADLEAFNIIKESKDTTLIKTYTDIISQKRELFNQSQIPIDLRSVDIDSLEKVITTNENMLLTSSIPYRKNVESKRIKWTDIQKLISGNDLVIEFVAFMDTINIPQEHYMALAFSKESAYPELLPLFTEKEMNAISPSKVSQLVWKPILDKFEEKKYIYFSPTGLLNNIGIEYMIDSIDNDADYYHVYRLSSTRELIEYKTEKRFLNAVLYGGLFYDVETDGMKMPHELISESYDNNYRNLLSTLIARGGFDSLPNTFLEVNEIGKILSAKEVQTTLLTGKEGTEASFKNLSDRNVSIMHLATHGMYLKPTDASFQKVNNNFRFIQLGEEEIREDDALTRSFLVMTGGNYLPRYASQPKMVEDGILTALEISILDFRGLDLVVLSACQTALGDINKEGVYGLQRAFKKAGANTILMSLDKVDDEATRILMVEFYKNLMSGKTKHQSLKDAQKYLRQVDNGKYDKPEYWASFIMLDGLN